MDHEKLPVPAGGGAEDAERAGAVVWSRAAMSLLPKETPAQLEARLAAMGIARAYLYPRKEEQLHEPGRGSVDIIDPSAKPARLSGELIEKVRAAMERIP